MSQSHRESSFGSYLFRRVVKPWLVIGGLLLVLAATSGTVALSLVDLLLIFGVAHLVLLWVILRTLQSISDRLDAGDGRADELPGGT
jgi:hypothetical protein